MVAVVPTGGRGTRLGWLGDFLPKSLVPIGSKPILHYIINNLIKMNISEIYLLVDYKKNLIRSYLQKQEEFTDVRFHYIASSPNLGLADVIDKTKNYIKIPFVVILGDDFTSSPQIAKFTNLMKSQQIIVHEAVIKEHNKKILSQTCEIYLNKNGLIKKAIEKPQKPHSKFRGTGLYLFQPEIFSYIKKTPLSTKTGKREITDTINLIAKEGKASFWLFKGVNININTQEDLVKANSLIYPNKQVKNK